MRKREVRVWGSGGSAGPGCDSVPRVSPQWMRRWVYTSVGVTPVGGASGSRWSAQEPDPAARALGSSGRGRQGRGAPGRRRPGSRRPVPPAGQEVGRPSAGSLSLPLNQLWRRLLPSRLLPHGPRDVTPPSTRPRVVGHCCQGQGAGGDQSRELTGSTSHTSGFLRLYLGTSASGPADGAT